MLMPMSMNAWMQHAFATRRTHIAPNVPTQPWLALAVTNLQQVWNTPSFSALRAIAALPALEPALPRTRHTLTMCGSSALPHPVYLAKARAQDMAHAQQAGVYASIECAVHECT